MGAYCDDGIWRYRKRVMKPDGKRIRITGTPALNTKGAAEHAEHLHILRITHPEMVAAATAKAAPQPREEPKSSVPTVREYAKTFLENYSPRDDKPSSREGRRQILE